MQLNGDEENSSWMKRDNGFLLAQMKIATVLHVQTMGEEGQGHDVMVLFYCKLRRVILYFRHPRGHKYLF